MMVHVPAQAARDLFDGCFVQIESNVQEYNLMCWEFLVQDQINVNPNERVVLRHRGPDKLIAVRPQSIAQVFNTRRQSATPDIVNHADELVEGCFVEIRPDALFDQAYNAMPWQFVRINQDGGVERVILRNGEHIVTVRRSIVTRFGPPPPPSEFARSIITTTGVTPMYLSSVESPSASVDLEPPPPAPVPTIPPGLASTSTALVVRGAEMPGARDEEGWAREVVGRATHGGNGKDWLLNRWFPIPLLGGNSILVKECNDPDYNLAMFPNLARAGLEMHFRSEWGNLIIRLEDFDYIKPCPQEQYWPWCCWCRKFLLPVEAHRMCKTHLRAKDYMKAFGPEKCRQMIIRGGYNLTYNHQEETPPFTQHFRS